MAGAATLSRQAEALGVDIRYQSEVTHLVVHDDQIEEIVFQERSGASDEAGDATSVEHRVRPKAVVAASGGFQADTDWLERAWGPGAQNFLIRGTPYNRGVVLRDLLEQGAQAVGDPPSATPWPSTPGAEVRRRHCLAAGLRAFRC